MTDDTTRTQKLYRSRRLKIIAGVCGGFAEYAKMDVTLVRVFWVLAALFNGAGILAYLVCLILMHENPDTQAEMSTVTAQRYRPEVAAGIVFIILGAAFLLRNTTGHDWWLPWHWHNLLQVQVREIWPILLIALGAGVLLRSFHDKETDKSQNSSSTAGRFVRSKSERMVGGVCGGLAQFWRVDVTLVRVIWVLTSLFVNFLAGGLLYILLMVLIPEESRQHGPSIP